jgi:hypothetical protein
VLLGPDPKTSLVLEITKFGLELLGGLGSTGARHTSDGIRLVKANDFWQVGVFRYYYFCYCPGSCNVKSIFFCLLCTGIILSIKFDN